MNFKHLINIVVLVSMVTGLFPQRISAREPYRGLSQPSIQSLFNSNTALLRFNQIRHQPGMCAGLTLHEAGFNQDANIAESVSATLYSRLTGDQETVTLGETGLDSGVFVVANNCVPTAPGPAASDGTLQVEPGDLIAALVLDDNEPHALATAIVAGGQAEGSFDLQIDPQILPQTMQSTPSVPGQPDFPLALVIANGVPAFFGEDQVIFRASSPAALDDFLARRGGTILNSVKIPTADPADPNQQEAEFLLIRVDPSTFDTAEMPYLMELVGVQGSYTYSSENAARLIAMLLEEQFAGNAVFPHGLMQYQGAPISNEGLHSDIFTRNWFNAGSSPTNRVKLGEATAMLEILDARQGPQIPVAIIDGGFAAPSDYTNTTPFFAAGLDNPDYGMTFNTIPQCEISPVGTADCSPGSAAGPNPLPCSGTGSCPFHGTEMFSVAGAEINNGFGSAGSGSSVVTPILLKVNFPYILPVAEAMSRAAGPLGARVINLSGGFPCRALVVDACEPIENILGTLVFITLCEMIRILIPPLAILPCEVILFLLTIPPMASAMEAAVSFAEARDVVITSSAGNSVNILDINFAPRPPEEVRLIPCVLGRVTCVAEIVAGGGNLVSSGVSAFGNGVDIWAPGNLARTPLPQNPMGIPPGEVVTFTSGAGTSGASAFMAGVAAIVRAVNPGLNRTQVRSLLLAAACRTGRTPTCIASSDTRVDGRGGYVDVLQTVHSALATVRPLDSKLLTCTGGWDELVNPADTRATANFLPLTLGPDDILEANFTGDLSIHALNGAAGGFDQDWFQIALPVSIAETNIRITLTTLAGAGALTAQVFDGLTPITMPFPAGTPFTTPPLAGGRSYQILVMADPSSPLNDNCYGGSTLRIEVARPPAADRFVGNDSPDEATFLNAWEHTDWLCGDEIRRARGNPDARCPDVFENDAGSKAAKDIWTMHIPELTLANLTEADFFHIRLPDYTNPAEGGHDDIRPSTPPRNPDPEPLLECGVVRREDFGIPSLDNTVNVNITGKLVIEAVPTDNSLTARPLDPDGETLGLYQRSGDTWARNDDLGTPPAPTLRKTIYCPQSDLDLSEIIFSLGERASSRPDYFSTGGYELNLAYVIEAERSRPDWVEEGYLGRIACLPRLSPGISSAIFGGDDFGLVPSVPFCPGTELGQAFLDFEHPQDGRHRPDCIDDSGPGCFEFFGVRWPETVSIFDLTFTAPPELSFRLFNSAQEMVGQAVPDTNGGSIAAQAPAKMRMIIPNLPPDLYILEVNGPPSQYTLEFVPPEVTAESPPGGGDSFIYLPIILRQ